ncbi:UNVERIFIED_CONTAM: hypothetical protein FKN15_020323, partial [Acipenser sinensis]
IKLGEEINLSCTNRTWSTMLYDTWGLTNTDKTCRIAHSNSEPAVNNCNDGRILINTTEGRSQLHIPPFNYTYEGIYKCQTAFQHGSHTTVFNVSAIVAKERAADLLAGVFDPWIWKCPLSGNGSQCTTVTVQSDGSTAVLNKDFTFRCSLSDPKVKQVTWQKQKDKALENVATYSVTFGAKVLEPYHQRVNFSLLGLNESSITIHNVQPEDEGCYMCLFNTYPQGSITGRSCFTVLVQSSIDRNGNGIVTVTSNLTLDLSSFLAEEISCFVSHSTLNEEVEKNITIREDKRTLTNVRSPGVVVLVILCIAALIIVTVACSVIRKRKKTKGTTVTVQSDGSTAVLNKDFTFRCSLSDPKVKQVTWQKQKDKALENVATYSVTFGAKVLEPYHQRVNFSLLGLNESSITIHNVQPEDEGCYMCLFNTYPQGSITGRSCFTVLVTNQVHSPGVVVFAILCIAALIIVTLACFVIRRKKKTKEIYEPHFEVERISKPESGHEEVKSITCSVTGKPAASISWNATEDVIVNPKQYSVVNPNGTITVTCNATVLPSRISNKEAVVTCIVTHLALTREKQISRVISVSAELVRTQRVVAATLGDNVSLRCELSKPKDVLQVTWQKTKGQSFENIATYNKRFGAKITDAFRDRVTVTQVGTDASCITIEGVRKEDETCYSCLFNAYPEGAIIGKTCLSVYEIYEPHFEVERISKPESGHEEVKSITCSVTGKPAASISWNATEDVIVNPKQYSVVNPNGTITVTCNATVLPSRISNKEAVVTCIVTHLALTREKQISRVISAKVITQGNITAILDQPLTIRCNVTIETGMVVKQIRWQKNPDESIASNNQNNNAVVSEEYRGRVNISLFKPQTTSITFNHITVTDEGCYTCLFDTYPEGEHHEQTCISITAKVITQGNITAILDQPLTIRCNVTIETGMVVKQIRWQKNPDESIASNNQNNNAVVSEEYRGRVNISLFKPQTTSITFNHITVTDEGCYTCLFDTYPEGEHHEQTCISITEINFIVYFAVQVKTEGNVTADVGQPVTLKCYYGIPKSVHQVRWKMLQNNKLEDLASYNIRFGDDIKDKFKDRFSINPGLSSTAISIKTVTLRDETCYICEFDTFPHGAMNGSTCLTVYVLPKPKLHLKRLQDGIQANCTASAKPAPDITWNIAGGNNTGNVTTTSQMLPTGITLVVSSLFVQTNVSEDDIICMVRHPGLESPITVSMSDQDNGVQMGVQPNKETPNMGKEVINQLVEKEWNYIYMYALQ